MDKVYHILLIEDEESDADLIEIELNKLDIQVQLDVIATKEELLDRLNHNLPDLIISDYNLPSLIGTEALKIVREEHPHLPFILVSGFIGEEKAVDAMLAGASDYAMKQNLDRLGPAILREITSYEEQRKQSAELKRSRKRYQNLVHSVNGIVWEADAETFSFDYVSPQSKEMLGYDPEDWVNTPEFWQDHIHPDDRREAINFCHYKTKQSEDHSFEYRMIDANDEVVWMRDYVSVISEDGKPDRLRGLMVDISSEKRTERQRDEAYEIASIGHWELDLINDELYWSDTVKKLHEVEQNYEPDLDTAINFYKEGEHRQKITDAVEHAIETGESFDLELKIITTNNNEQWVRVVGEADFREGECVRIFGSTQNITERKEIEQKLRDVVEHSTNMFYRHDTDHVLSYVSPQSQDFLGCSPEEAKRRWTEFATDHPINEEGFKNTQQAIDTGVAQPSFPLQLQKTNGDTIWVRVNEAPIVEDGETVAIVGSLTDITAQKKYEEDLLDTNKKLKTAQEIAKLGYWEEDWETGKIYWSDQTHRIWGFDPDETTITLEKIIERMHPDDVEAFKRQNEKTHQEHLPLNIQHRIVLPDGEVKWMDVLGTVKKTNDGTPLSVEGTVQDITETKKLEELLHQTNRLAKVGSWELDLSGEGDADVYWSEMTRDILEVEPGYNPTLEEAIDFYPPQSREKVEKAVEKAIEDGTPFDQEVLVKTAKDNEQWVRTIGQPEFVDGECVRVYGSYQDIHDRKTSELELERRNAFIETIMDNLPIGTAVHYIDSGQNIFTNKKFCEIYGWPPEELTDVDAFFETVFPDPERRKKIKSRVVADMDSGNPERMQWSNLQITTKEGEKRIVDAKNIPLIDQNQMISTVIDVTAEKEAEEERKLILESISDAFYAVDGDWNFTYFNSEAEKLLDKKSEDVLGNNIWEVFAPAKDTELYDRYKEVMETGQSKPAFEYFYPPIESWFEVSVYAREEGLSVFFKNIDDRKEWERELKKLNEQLEQRAEELAKTNEELEQFAYVASHDLQEPLRMVSSFLKRLEEKYQDQLDDKAQQYIDFAVDGSQRMRRIILDLLNYSRMNQQELESEEVDLNILLEDIVKLDQSAIKESNASISWDDLPTIDAARTPIRQVFENLINNGIKYRNPEEEPEITIKAKDKNDYWQFAVSDNGIGIKEEFQDNIFTIFKRLHTQDEYSGTGIGLSVSQKIVEKHGGEIWVESKEGEGSTFYFTIKKNEQT